MPLALQSKLLRFVECGELQRVGDNETVKVDVRIIAATHRPLAQQARDGGFRSDLYYRLAVFLIRTPALAEHARGSAAAGGAFPAAAGARDAGEARRRERRWPSWRRTTGRAMCANWSMCWSAA